MTTCAVQEISAKETSVYQSRWGFHPCDHETFRKLKMLHKYFWKATAGLAMWFRWNRKDPQNRVIRERIKDKDGRIIGRKVIGPQPEPQYCPIFGRPTYRSEWRTIPEHLDMRIVHAYQNARMPQPRDKVVPLKITPAEIDKLYDELMAWLAQ